MMHDAIVEAGVVVLNCGAILQYICVCLLHGKSIGQTNANHWNSNVHSQLNINVPATFSFYDKTL